MGSATLTFCSSAAPNHILRRHGPRVMARVTFSISGAPLTKDEAR